MDLYARIETDMKSALKEGNAVKVSVLRMVISAAKMLVIEKNLKSVSEGDILQILQRQIKQRKESIEQFEKGKRQDLADKESQELKILESYLPKQLSEDEIKSIIKEAIAETGARAKSDMGKVMKVVTEKTRGRADGKLVSQLVTGMLQ